MAQKKKLQVLWARFGDMDKEPRADPSSPSNYPGCMYELRDESCVPIDRLVVALSDLI